MERRANHVGHADMTWPLSSAGLVIAASLAFAALPGASGAGDESNPAGEKQVTMEYAKSQFDHDCAPCHGIDGRGDGPLAAKIDHKLPDLTVLAKNNGGIFPFERVYKIIDGTEMPPGHGPMPAWGEAYKFRPEKSSYVILELSNYLNRLQRK
jgi:mono/diheme cytochrome c family protein